MRRIEASRSLRSWPGINPWRIGALDREARHAGTVCKPFAIIAIKNIENIAITVLGELWVERQADAAGIDPLVYLGVEGFQFAGQVQEEVGFGAIRVVGERIKLPRLLAH